MRLSTVLRSPLAVFHVVGGDEGIAVAFGFVFRFADVLRAFPARPPLSAVPFLS